MKIIEICFPFLVILGIYKLFTILPKNKTSVEKCEIICKPLYSKTEKSLLSDDRCFCVDNDGILKLKDFL